MHLKTLLALAATSLVALTSLHADTAESAELRNLNNRVTALEQRKGASGMINPQGRPQVKNGADLFVFGDLVYWNAHENGLNYAVTNRGPDTNLAHAKVKNIHGKWNAGFRVGVGYNTPHDGWDTRVTWLRFTDNGSRGVNPGVEHVLYPTMAAAADPVAELGGARYKTRSHWHLRINQLDLDLGREFFVSKWLTVRPHAGLRSDWIHQDWTGSYKDKDSANSISTHYKDRWWGLGLEGGLDTQWGLGAGWSIFGNLAAAIIYGFHDIDMTERDHIALAGLGAPAPSSTYADLDQTYRISHPILDLQMGVRWDNMFCDDRIHLGLQVGWEHHIYFSQNQFPKFYTSVNPGMFASNQGDLTLQGWTLSARLDF